MDGARGAEGHRRGVFANLGDVRPRGFDAEHLHVLILEEGGEQADGVAPAADTRHGYPAV